MRVLFLVFVFFLVFGCIQQQHPESALDFASRPDVDRATILCQKTCMEKKASGADFSSGPCVGNELVPDWVCDIAHFPRQAIDNLPENQCSAFREGKAKHFVELGTDCEVIKTY